MFFRVFEAPLCGARSYYRLRVTLIVLKLSAELYGGDLPPPSSPCALHANNKMVEKLVQQILSIGVQQDRGGCTGSVHQTSDIGRERVDRN